jgi:hypothetical protein
MSIQSLTARDAAISQDSRRDPVTAVVRDASARATMAVGLGGIAVIHAVDSVGKWSEVRYVFWLYMALIVGAIATGALALLHPSRNVFLATAALAGSAFAGYVLSRTTGLPNATDDIGNWTEPLGLASLVVEGLVVALGLAAYRWSG